MTMGGTAQPPILVRCGLALLNPTLLVWRSRVVGVLMGVRVNVLVVGVTVVVDVSMLVLAVLVMFVVQFRQ